MAQCFPLFSEEDADLRELRWSLTRDGYARRTFRIAGPDGKKHPVSVEAHRVVAFRMKGRIPRALQCDHINGVPLDNRRENIRLVTPSQNLMNRAAGSRNTSGVVGVNYNRSYHRWNARIMGKHLGCFLTLEEAALVRRAAEVEIFGEYARRPSDQ
ncbi:MAG TPA: HNH endonuclease signature motif containing protein [Geminicoccus sp.]|uniref:HNH endonuclease signature motif containing protein n=1 Tax=Geminicoccus sp. TaxID=2024832 RepID=UPI002BD686DB|nr:HNH endonuclease signature motif containing protein [Geminicoccus sp.]HWL72128.1 HNH endonuclease signature motif containing protein [Geminicoccus sp.]